MLRILCEGSLDDLRNYKSVAAKKTVVDSHGISWAYVEHSLQLLSLCRLAAKKPSLKYAEIAAALSVQEEEVEGWVIEVISEGLLEASIDQFNATVTIG